MTALNYMTIWEVAGLLRRREVSPTEVMEECIRASKRLQPVLNPYITFLEEEARGQAAAQTEAWPDDLEAHPLWGIPFGLKDLFETKAILTSGGSGLYAAYYPEADCDVAARLKQEGAILLGKTNMQELGCGAAGTVSHYGLMRNPHDPTKIAGGSSGGSAIAVATGMNYLAMGSDTGGSIRIPASLCGVVGFKPTHGLVPLQGVLPLSQAMDHAGPITRSVLDAAIAMDALTGSRNYARQVQKTDRLDGCTIGVPDGYFFEKTAPSIERLVREAVSRLEELGARIRPVAVEQMDDLPEVSFDLMMAEAVENYREALMEEPCKIHPWIRARLMRGFEVTPERHARAAQRRREMLAVWNRMMTEVDAVLCPTLPLTAFPIEGDHRILLRGREEDAIGLLTHHTRYSNVTGSPALTIPVGLADDGLPAGLMLMGGVGHDLDVLRIGYAYERHFPFVFRQF